MCFIATDKLMQSLAEMKPMFSDCTPKHFLTTEVKSYKLLDLMPKACSYIYTVHVTIALFTVPTHNKVSFPVTVSKDTQQTFLQN